jgi:hypothetical protein
MYISAVFHSIEAAFPLRITFPPRIIWYQNATLITYVHKPSRFHASSIHPSRHRHCRRHRRNDMISDNHHHDHLTIQYWHYVSTLIINLYRYWNREGYCLNVLYDRAFPLRTASSPRLHHALSDHDHWCFLLNSSPYIRVGSTSFLTQCIRSIFHSFKIDLRISTLFWYTNRCFILIWTYCHLSCHPHHWSSRY